MAAYRRVYDSRHLQVDCQEPGSAPEPYAFYGCDQQTHTQTDTLNTLTTGRVFLRYAA